MEELLIVCANDCPTSILPIQDDGCEPQTWGGRIKEILFVPCTEAINPAWMLDLANWIEYFVTTGFLGRRTGAIIGSYAKTGGEAFDDGSNCGVPSLVGVKFTWELTAKKYIIDRSLALATHNFANLLQRGAINNYKLFATFCDAPDMILPIGKVALTKLDNALPEGVDDKMLIEYGFSWKQKGIPTPFLVPGLGAVLSA